MKNNYIIAALWFLLHVLISSLNDCLATSLSRTLPSFEVVFLRFAFSILTLLPFMLYKGLASFKTTRLYVHAIRGLLLFIGIAIWVVCLGKVPLVMVTIMGFTIPICFIVLAYFFLNEKIDWQRFAITIAGFAGVIIVINPTSINFNPLSLLLLVAVFAFAMLDVVNKKFVSEESILCMLFYSSLFTCLFSSIPSFYVGFIWPDSNDLLLCFLLGAGANLILYAILKAFSLADATALAPLRYFELILSTIFGFIFFKQVPTKNIYLGALIIILCNVVLIIAENRKKKLSN